MKQHTKILLGLFAGMALGLLAKQLLEQDAVQWLVTYLAYPIGQFFLKFVFMAVVPMVFSAIALGIADIGDVKKIGKIGVKTLLFTIVITLVGVLLSISLVNLIQPGHGFDEANKKQLLAQANQNNQLVGKVVTQATESKSVVQTLLDIIPKNPLLDAAYALEGSYSGGGLLALMFFAVIFGIAMSLSNQDKVKPISDFLKGMYEIMMSIVGMALRFAPFGVAGLMFSTASQLGLDVLIILAKYVAVVILALSLHVALTYGLILKFGANRSPLDFFRNISEIFFTAFSTSSSSATLPTAIRVSNDAIKKRPDIVNFVLTVGATANQNGTALYEGATVLFLAQFYGVELTLAQQVVVVLLSVLAGIGTAGVPGGSLPFVVMVLQTIGVPAEGVGIILGVDRLLDMSRTVVNVVGDVTLAAWVVEREN